MTFFLSKKGEQLLQLEYKQRQLAIIQSIIQHRVFSETLKLCLRSGEIPNTKDIVKIMKSSNLYKVEADKTYERRASTITSWLNWILSTIDEFD